MLCLRLSISQGSWLGGVRRSPSSMWKFSIDRVGRQHSSADAEPHWSLWTLSRQMKQTLTQLQMMTQLVSSELILNWSYFQVSWLSSTSHWREVGKCLVLENPRWCLVLCRCSSEEFTLNSCTCKLSEGVVGRKLKVVVFLVALLLGICTTFWLGSIDGKGCTGMYIITVMSCLPYICFSQ